MKLQQRKFSGNWIGVTAIMLIAFFLRLVAIGRESLWLDEAISYLSATLPVSQILKNIVQSSHPPLYYLALHFWRIIVPDNDGALRILGTLFNVALIPILFWLGQKLFTNRVAALWAALLVAISPFHLLYSHELRMYTLLMLLVTLGAAAFWQAHMTKRWLWWVCFAGCYFLAVYTHLFAFLGLAGIGIFALLRYNDRETLWRTVVVVLIILILFLPWVLILLGERQTELGSMRPLARPVEIEVLKPLTTPAFLLFGLSDQIVYTGVALFLVLAIFVVFLLDLRRIRQDNDAEPVLFLLLMTACFLGIPLGVYLIRPFFLPERTMAAASPFLLLLLAWSATRRHSPLPYLVIGTAITMFAGTAIYLSSEPIKPLYRESTAYISAQFQAGDVVLHTSDGSYLPALRYARDLRQGLLAGDPDPRKPDGVYEALGGQVWSLDDIEKMGNGRLWLVVALEHSIEWQQAQVKEVLARYSLSEQRSFDGIQLLLFDLTPSIQTPASLILMDGGR